MSDLIASGRLIDIIIALMLAEAAALWLYRRRTGRGLAAADIGINLVAGGSLMLAVRAALTDAGPGWIAVCLATSLLAHLADLAHRWRAGSPGRHVPLRTAPQTVVSARERA